MPREITVAVLQSAFGANMDANIARVADLTRQAADAGAQAILPPELFQGPYFCKVETTDPFATAYPWREHPVVTRLAPLAGELGVVLPLSIFEKDGPHYYNSLVMADADGSLLGLIARATSPTGRAMRRSTISAPATRASASGTRNSAASASGSAGTSGSRRPPAR